MLILPIIADSLRATMSWPVGVFAARERFLTTGGAFCGEKW